MGTEQIDIAGGGISANFTLHNVTTVRTTYLNLELKRNMQRGGADYSHSEILKYS